MDTLKLVNVKMGNASDTHGTYIAQALIFQVIPGITENYFAITKEGIAVCFPCKTINPVPFWYSTMVYPSFWKGVREWDEIDDATLAFIRSRLVDNIPVATDAEAERLAAV